jgi:hypothetical protein
MILASCNVANLNIEGADIGVVIAILCDTLKVLDTAFAKAKVFIENIEYEQRYFFDKFICFFCCC